MMIVRSNMNVEATDLCDSRVSERELYFIGLTKTQRFIDKTFEKNQWHRRTAAVNFVQING
jgi:hypothetical protein